MRELLGPAVGENILGLDIDALKARLRASPWVADATVSRTLPDTLRVEIHERVPLALAEVERLYLMDGGRRPHRHLRPAHRRLRPAHRARPGAAWTRRRAASAPQRAGALLARPRRPGGRGLRGRGRGPRATCGWSCAARRGAAPGRAALPRARPHLPGPAPGADRALPGRRVLRPAVPRPHLREAAPAPGRALETTPPPGGGTRIPGGAGGRTARCAARRRRSRPETRVRCMTSTVGEGGQLSRRRRTATSSASTSGPTRSARSWRRSPTRAASTSSASARRSRKGLRKGVVINLEATVDSIKRVVEEAELMAGVEIGSAYVGLAGTHIRGFNSRGRDRGLRQEPRHRARGRGTG